MKTRIPLAEADLLAASFVEEAKKRGMKRIEVCGSVRRKEPFVGDLDVVVEGDLQMFEFPTPIGEIFEGGMERVSLTYKGVHVNVFRSVPEEWGAAIFYATGPAKYQIAYRAKAKYKHWLLNNHGLFDQDGKKMAGETEGGIYKAFGKEWKPPEKRGKK